MVAAVATVKTTWGLIVDEGTGWASKTWIHKRCWLQQEAATVQRFLLGFGCKCQGCCGCARAGVPVCWLPPRGYISSILSFFVLSFVLLFFLFYKLSFSYVRTTMPIILPMRIVGLFGEMKAHRQRKSETITNPKTLLQFSLTVAHPRTAAQRCLPPFLPTFSVSC